MEILKDKLAVVVVTYNRLDFLKKIYKSISEQTKKPDKIIIINNSSTDGTLEWLQETSKNDNILHFITQPNSGSSGGQYTAFRTAYEQGYEWIWEMDDDVVPEPNCLEVLWNHRDTQTIIAPLRFTKEGEVFYNEIIKFNLTNIFKTFWDVVTNPTILEKDIVYVEGLTFEGAFFHRSVISRIGLPDKRIFIFGDDTDFSIRAKLAGFKLALIPKAKMNRLLSVNYYQQIHTPKRYYIIRNQMLADRFYGNWCVRNFRPWIYFFKWLFARTSSFQDIKITFKAFWDALKTKPLNDYYEQK